MRLDRVLTPNAVAALAGWSRRRMLRHLLRADARADGALLVNVGSAARPRWTVTLGALQRIAPAWFVDEEGIEARVAGLEERVACSERVVEIHTERLVVMRAGD